MIALADREWLVSVAAGFVCVGAVRHLIVEHRRERARKAQEWLDRSSVRWARR